MPPVHKVVLMSGFFFLAMGTLGGFYFFPKMLNDEVDKSKALKKGTLIRGMFEDFPFPLSMQINIFNVTNPADVMQGEKPIVQEVGPFIYDEYKSKSSIKDRNKDDTVLYRPVTKYYYNQAASGLLTGNEMVTIPDVFLLTAVMAVERDHPPMLQMINKAINAIYNKPETIYMTVKVKDLLFDGILINCTVKAFAAKAVCLKLKDEVGKNLKLVAEDLYSFSLFGMKNGTEGELHRVNRGIKNATMVAQVLTFKNEKYLSVWPEGGHCNNISGTDGSVFAPRFTKEDSVKVFSGDICRPLALTYDRDDVYKGIPVYIYKGNFGDIPHDRSLQCYCPTNVTCPKKGSYDLSKCNGSPVVLTLPHFYLADPEFMEGVIGLKPGGEDYEMLMQFEPISGSPLVAQFRFQFNVELHKVDKVDVTKNLKTTMHPILWIQDGIIIPDKFVDMIGQLMLGIVMIDKGKWVMSVLGIVLLIAGNIMSGKQKTAANVTPVEPFEADSPTHKKIQAFIKDSNVDPWRVRDSAMIRY